MYNGGFFMFLPKTNPFELFGTLLQPCHTKVFKPPESFKIFQLNPIIYILNLTKINLYLNIYIFIIIYLLI